MSPQAVRPLIALVSAVPAAIPPAVAAFAAEYPGAELWNILDDRLLTEADARGGLTPDLSERMARLLQHAAIEGADEVLVTCSMYGDAVHAAVDAAALGQGLALPPVLASDDSAFDAVLAAGHRSVLVISPAAGPLADSLARLRAAAAALGVEVEITGAVAEGAPALSAAGDTAGLGALLERTVRAAQASGDPSAVVDAVLLGQYSLAPGGELLAAATGLEVVTAPASAARALRAAIDRSRES